MIAPSPSTKSRPKVVLLFGPTGVGKTEIVDRLFSGRGEIISADSMQVYRGMDIGTAKPSAALRNRLPHHLIDIRDPKEQFCAGDFLDLAERILIPQIEERGHIPVISGGTAFYFRNFLYGLSEAPRSTPEIRALLKQEREERGLKALYRELDEVDPVSAERIAPQDGCRVLRALEVFRLGGRPLSSYTRPDTLRRDYDCLAIGLTRPRAELYRRIDLRVEMMMDQGLEAEVRGLLKGGCTEEDPGMRGIGYREFFQAAREGCTSRRTIVEEIKKNSRRYAKRQLSFFAAIPGVFWMDPREEEQIFAAVEGFLLPALGKSLGEGG